MQMRFDGYLGFPGGLIDAGENIVDGLNRELAEEIGLDLEKHRFTMKEHRMTHINKSSNLILHFFGLKISLDEFVAIEKGVLRAEEYGIEVRYVPSLRIWNSLSLS